MAEVPGVRLDKLTREVTEISRSELVDLHKLAIDEYRFEVKLNWDRMQYYLVLNTAITTAGAGLLKIGDAALRPLVAFVFVLGISTALLAVRAVDQGHRYYNQAVYKKTLIEHLLGRLQTISGFTYSGANLSIATTPGMSEWLRILESPEEWVARKTRPTSIKSAVMKILWLFAGIDTAAVLYCLAPSIASLQKLL